jgi:hypothetical protein
MEKTKIKSVVGAAFSVVVVEQRENLLTSLTVVCARALGCVQGLAVPVQSSHLHLKQSNTSRFNRLLKGKKRLSTAFGSKLIIPKTFNCFQGKVEQDT